MADVDELKDALPGLAAKVDGLRARALGGLERAADARQAGLERERDRLSRRLGPDHPRVHEVVARIEDAAVLRRDVVIERDRADAVAPSGSADEWVLHGTVRFAEGAPAPDLVVSLMDSSGRAGKDAPSTRTDRRGAFVLRVRAAANASAPTAIPTLFVLVADAGGRVLLRGQERMLVLPGAVDYREVALDTRGPAGPKEEPRPRPQPRPAKPPVSRTPAAKPTRNAKTPRTKRG